jgi:hypothetical protein
MPWGAAIGAVGAIGGALISSNAASSASGQQAQSSADAIAEQRRQYDTTRSDYAPYRAAGVDALGQLQTDVNKPVSAADAMSDPGYQFGLDQGQQAIDRKIAAAGGRISGASIKAADRFGTNYAATGYNAAYQRRQDRLNRLASIAGLGQTATSGSAQAGTAAGNAISGIIQSQGDASAAGTLAQGNIWANTGNQLAALYGRAQNTVPAGGIYGSTVGGTGVNNGYGSDTIYNGWGG